MPDFHFHLISIFHSNSSFTFLNPPGFSGNQETHTFFQNNESKSMKYKPKPIVNACVSSFFAFWNMPNLVASPEF